MSSISNRLGKLEREQLEASVAKARSVDQMTDRELLEAILHTEGVEISDEELEAQIPRFHETGEIPGMPGITVEYLVRTRRSSEEN